MQYKKKKTKGRIKQYKTKQNNNKSNQKTIQNKLPNKNIQQLQQNGIKTKYKNKF